MEKINLKTEDEVAKMAECGKKLHFVREELRKAVKIGTNSLEIEELAQKLIKKVGGKPSFAMVEGYHWATCVNINEGLVHGIPKREVVFKKGDVVSVDVGIYDNGFHTDTSFTVGLEVDSKTKLFLKAGEKALKRAISAVKEGNRIYDLSCAIESEVRQAGFTPIYALVGHGVGRALHEEPTIPCFTQGERENSLEIKNGLVLAIEVMYTMGSPEVEIDKDGWTILVRDGKISALYEETVAVTRNGPQVLT
jgi:methionyl aminopeptidase